MSSLYHPERYMDFEKSLLTHDQAQDMLRGKKLAFIVGSPRSGTTWLQLLLSRSPAIATALETNLFTQFMRPMVEQWNHDRITGQLTGLTKLLSDEEFRDLLRITSAFVFAKIAQSKTSATVVLEKTPHHLDYAREILDLWPEAHFIHIIRDPRSVAASLRVASKTWASQWASSRVSPSCERWIADVSTGRQISSATQNYHEVFYHELISDGPNIVMRLLNKLGVPSSLEDCQRYVDECNIENLRAGKLDNAPWDVAMSKVSLGSGTTDSWRAELSAWEIALVEHVAGPLMSELGFRPVNGSKAMAALVSTACTFKDAPRVVKRRFRNFLERRR
jgi:Sulfotransferase family